MQNKMRLRPPIRMEPHPMYLLPIVIEHLLAAILIDALAGVEATVPKDIPGFPPCWRID